MREENKLGLSRDAGPFGESGKERPAQEKTKCGLEQGLPSQDISMQDSPATVTTDQSCVQLARFPSSILPLQEEVSVPLDSTGLDMQLLLTYCKLEVRVHGGYTSFPEPELQALADSRSGRKVKELTRLLLEALSYWNALQSSSGLTQGLLEPCKSLQPLLGSRLDILSSIFYFKKIWIALQSSYSLSHLTS